jgi:hypothetical protein
MNGGNISGNSVNLGGSRGGGVYVGGYASFTMNRGEISGNTASGTSSSTSIGGGVFVATTATFTMMNGGEISGNTTDGSGGGVYVYERGTFTMHGGEISGNSATRLVTSSTSYGSGGGGVCAIGLSGYPATFIMHGGKISGNTSSINGGGVFVEQATFTMLGGEISGNTANGYVSSGDTDWYGGGGVFVYGTNATFAMRGGEIYGNTAARNGGGVYVYSGTSTTFRISTGTIYGSTETETKLRNTAGSSTRGPALYKGTNGVAQRGTFSDPFSGTNEGWVSKGNLGTTPDTIKVENGEPVQ